MRAKQSNEFPHVSEGELQAGTLKYLSHQPDLLAWRVNAGKVQTSGGHWFMGAPIGTPDICGHIVGGRAFYIELKTPKGKITPEQRAWHAEARSRGVAVFLCRNFEAVLQAVRALRGPYAAPLNDTTLEAHRAMLRWNLLDPDRAPICKAAAREHLHADALRRRDEREVLRFALVTELEATLRKPGAR
jgi:VRR-NUC domain